MDIDKQLKKFNQLKIDLLKISQCIDYCSDEGEEEFYRNIALEYSKELKKLKEYIEKNYDIKFCNCFGSKK
ncbi:hypothetical protein [Bacillus sp. FJAT-47783]|uniref:hypothetical protein n=1 Tax=Bacillus sp. FJAT-47783 TaxID=2922712 RepID=UPI001FABBED3|nr:hypothetical protein [Bacillus sp. FJAT-47783]